jgi:hypothetical protein
MAVHYAVVFSFLKGEHSQRKVMTTLIPYGLDWVLMEGTKWPSMCYCGVFLTIFWIHFTCGSSERMCPTKNHNLASES